MPFAQVSTDALAQFLRATSAATWRVGADGYVMDVPEWSALTGQTAEEARGDGWMDAIHPDDVLRVRAAWQTAVSHGSLYNTDYRLRCADGTFRWFNARGMAMLAPDGSTTGWVGVILAISGASRANRLQSDVEQGRPNQFAAVTPTALRSARGILGWSTEELARRADVSRSTVRRLEEDGTVNTRPRSIAKVLDVLTAGRLCAVAKASVIVGFFPAD